MVSDVSQQQNIHSEAAGAACSARGGSISACPPAGIVSQTMMGATGAIMGGLTDPLTPYRSDGRVQLGPPKPSQLERCLKANSQTPIHSASHSLVTSFTCDSDKPAGPRRSLLG